MTINNVLKFLIVDFMFYRFSEILINILCTPIMYNTRY